MWAIRISVAIAVVSPLVMLTCVRAMSGRGMGLPPEGTSSSKIE